MIIKTVIADDEEYARNSIEKALQAYDDFEIVGRADNGAQAVDIVKTNEPDLVFLDIMMPVMTGVEVARQLVELPMPPHIVFITAHNGYAVDAFEINAIDYLLKPLDVKRFEKTVEKIQTTIGNREKKDTQLHSLLKFLQEEKAKKISCYERGMKDKILVAMDNILYIYVKDTETYVVTEESEYLTSMNLKKLFSMLDPRRFFQTHRAYIVNLDRVVKVCPLFSGNYTLILNDKKKTKIPLSRAQAKELKQIIDI